MPGNRPKEWDYHHSYPVKFSDWENAYLSGNGKMGIIVFGNPLNETVIFNDRGFNMAKTRERSFAQVSAADINAIRNSCAAGNFEEANRLAVTSVSMARWRRRKSPPGV